MDIINKKNKGEFLPFKYNSKFYMYLRANNQLHEIEEHVYTYIISPLSLKSNSKIETDIIKNIQFINEESVNPNLYINISTKEKEIKALTIKQVLENYNKCNKIYLIIEINQETLDFIDDINEWIAGFERLVIICSISEDKKYLFNNLKSLINNYSNLKFIVEQYKTAYSINLSDTYKKVKISSLISSKKMSTIEKNHIISFLIKNKNDFDKSLKLNLKTRPSIIQTITANELITTNDDFINNCNSCWAKKSCHSNQYYKVFSSHPYICNLNEQNCVLIRSTFLKTIHKNIDSIELQIKDKLSNKPLKLSNYKISHIN